MSVDSASEGEVRLSLIVYRRCGAIPRIFVIAAVTADEPLACEYMNRKGQRKDSNRHEEQNIFHKIPLSRCWIPSLCIIFFKFITQE